MGFEFGSFRTDSLPGCTATLSAWPSPALKPEMIETPDGAFYARTSIGPITFSFDVLVMAATPSAVHTLRDQFVAGCHPEGGLQALTPDSGEGWFWWATLSNITAFERGLWVPGANCQLRGGAHFTAPDGVGWARPDETASGATSATITRTKGNLGSFPRIEVRGTFTRVTVTVGGQPITISTPVAAGQKLVLDYNLLDFAVYSETGTKLRHVAEKMSTLRRISLPLGSTPVTTTTEGTVTAVSVEANSRKG
ncbi:MAG: hypothetical protein Q4B08_07610 [Propionibacteriaceae bacterium]|nr:hypothetical protein [Propionibacteriaceae bacterium]